MRRTVLAFATVATTLTASVFLAGTAEAIGPGGWDHVGVGSSSTSPSLSGGSSVTALNTENPGVLYVGGNFTSAGGLSKAQRVARWDGSAWRALGSNGLTNGGVFALAYHAGKLYVGGTFVNAGGNPNADFLAVWDGSSWAPFCNSLTSGPAITANVNALQIVGNKLYVGGSFQNGAGIASADYLVGCDLTTGAASSTASFDGSFSGSVYALAADSNGTLYAGGGFINLEAIPAADHVAAYDGSWHAMGSGNLPTDPAVDSFVRSLTAAGTNVYVGTDSVNVAGIPRADHVARWNGSAWSAVGANTAGTNGWFPTSATIDALRTYGSLVVAAGSFQNANGVATADNIAYFDGSQWRPVGSNGAGNGPLGAHPTSLGIVGGKVYVGGNFTTAGGDQLARLLSAYALRQPDAAIGATTTGSFIGNNVYSAVGTGEVRTVRVHRRHSTTAYVRIQNDGLAAASFSISGTGHATGFSVRYFRGSTEITSAVRAGTYTLPSLAPRSSTLVRMSVHVARAGASAVLFLTSIRSQSGTPHDAVRFVVKAAS